MWYNDEPTTIRDTRRLGRIFDDDSFEIDIRENAYFINGENKLCDINLTGEITKKEEYYRRDNFTPSFYTEGRLKEDESLYQTPSEQTRNENRHLNVNNIDNLDCDYVEDEFKRISVNDNSIISQADNLIEEMYTKNIRHNHNNKDYRNVWDNSMQTKQANNLRCYKRFLSRSTQHIREATVNEEDILGDGYQSLPYRRNQAETIDRGDLFTSLPQLTNLERFDVLITIDIGTYYSGYAYCYGENDGTFMIKNLKERKWKKVPSVLLLNSRTEFHSFGEDAIENFINIERNISPSMSQWLLFDKFKFQLHNVTDVNRGNAIKATNGTSATAVTVFSRTLGYFKCRALKDISRIFGKSVRRDDVKWIVTIPVSWSHAGKIFIQEAAYEAGLCTPETSNSRLTVSYEADAALSWCVINHPIGNSTKHVSDSANYVILMNCGGGTVDISIHEFDSKRKGLSLVNIHKISENIYSSIGVDDEFIQLLNDIFGTIFLDKFRLERPASFIRLLSNFESCKWILSPDSSQSANIQIPDGFTEMYSQFTGEDIKYAFLEFGRQDIVWHEEAHVIAVNYFIIAQLFQPILQKIIKMINKALRHHFRIVNPLGGLFGNIVADQINIILRNRVDESRVLCLYVTGGLAKSSVLRKAVNENFSARINVVFPDKDPELYVLKGSIQKFVNSTENKIHKAPYAYALGVLKPFQDNVHPVEKLVVKNGIEWCCDLLDIIVRKDQVLCPGEIMLKRYQPANNCQSHIIINIYSVENENSQFVTDSGVHNCGVLHLATLPTVSQQPREILFQLTFSGSDFIASILDTTSGRSVQIQLDPVSYL